MAGGSPFERVAALFDRWAQADPIARQFGIEALREPLRTAATAVGYQTTWADLFVVTASTVDRLVGTKPTAAAAPAAPAAPAGAAASSPPPPYGSGYYEPTPRAWRPGPQWHAPPPPWSSAPPPPPPPPPPSAGPAQWPPEMWKLLDELLEQMRRTADAAPPRRVDGKLAAAFAVLGVPATSTWSRVKAAYRVKARELHPDLNKDTNATARFQALQEAYSVLERANAAGHFRGRE